MIQVKKVMRDECPCDRDKTIDPVCAALGECSRSRLDEDSDDDSMEDGDATWVHDSYMGAK